MKKYLFKCQITLGNISKLETNTQKKAVSDFLKSFKMEASFRRIQLDKCTSGYCYTAGISYENPDYLKVLRFSEALCAFCLFWHLFYEEFCLCEIESPVPECKPFQ